MVGIARWQLRVAALAALMATTGVSLTASGHGPVFGGATPTLGKGGWSFDQAWMSQVMNGSENSALLRSMISFGVTQKVQVSASLPIPLGETSVMTPGRMTAMMSGNTDFESLVAWRFQTRPVGEGARLESTAYVGGLLPFDSERGGISTSPAGLVSAASGYASRSHYLWAGAGYLHYAQRAGDQLGSVTSFSLVYGYRPPAWRKDYPKPDVRFFVEASGDITGTNRHDGQVMPETGSHVALVGPTVLFLYKAYAVEGGVQFPVYQRTGASQPHERFRAAVNFTYFFWPSKGNGH